ncbi:MAG: TRAP transporter large permease subunit [Leptospirales bacterium]|jgi:tripartite ATP-independent transporter DctM subunit
MSDHGLIAIFMFLSMVLMLLTGRQIFAIIGAVATVFALMLWGKGGFSMTFQATIKLMNWFVLLTLPIFIYMGYMFAKTKIADDLYEMIHVWMGQVRGGLAVGTVLLMAIISAINGLSVAGMAVGSTVALPEMKKRDYDEKMLTGVIQAGSSLGILIPPSVVLILYGMIARQPVGKLWLAGVIPGLILAGLFIAYILFACYRNPSLGPAISTERQISRVEKLKLLSAAIFPLVIIFSMLGLFFMGVTSIVESSAIGATMTTVVALVKRRLSFKIMREVLHDTLLVSSMFMWIILAALAFGAVFDGLGAVRAIEELFLGYGFGPWGIIIMMQLSFLIMGMFLDDTAMLIIVAPLYVPLVIKLDFDPVWYGVLYTITCQIAYLTPPFGYNLFLMKAMAPEEITLATIYRSVVPFVCVMIFSLILFMIFPGLVTWLPNTFYGD